MASFTSFSIGDSYCSTKLAIAATPPSSIYIYSVAFLYTYGCLMLDEHLFLSLLGAKLQFQRVTVTASL